MMMAFAYFPLFFLCWGCIEGDEASPTVDNETIYLEPPLQLQDFGHLWREGNI